MICPICEKEIYRAKGPLAIEDEQIFVCEICWKKAEDEPFFDRMDWIYSNREMAGAIWTTI
ncbi:hypothetical protein QUF80_04120 [Desulfococcaceae bacterium HSG8]|nr:hypothetical protein [Desulfococcaceae bacterium HSG8]